MSTTPDIAPLENTHADKVVVLNLFVLLNCGVIGLGFVFPDNGFLYFASGAFVLFAVCGMLFALLYNLLFAMRTTNKLGRIAAACLWGVYLIAVVYYVISYIVDVN